MEENNTAKNPVESKKVQFQEKVQQLIHTENNKNEEEIQIINQIDFCSKCQSQYEIENMIQIIENDQNDFLICEQCLIRTTQEQNKQLVILQEEIKQLQLKLGHIEDNISMTLQKNKQQLQETDEAAEQVKEQALLSELQNLETIQKNQKKDLLELKQKVLGLQKEEAQYWEEINKLERNVMKLEAQNSMAEVNLKLLNEEINRLNSINIINDIFHISCDEQAGTINGLMIGKQSNSEIDWEETNAGLGQMAILFSYLVSQFNYQFRFIDHIQCNGSFSKIKSNNQSQDKSDLYPFYGPVQNKNDEEIFNTVICIFIKQFASFVNFLQGDREFISRQIEINLPHKIYDDKIDDDGYMNTFKYETQKWDQWSLMMQSFLADLKYIIQINNVYDHQIEQDYFTQK